MTEVERVGGEARGYSWPPFTEGNAVGERHGFYSRLRPDDRDEIEQAAVAIREAMSEAGSYATAFEPTLMRMAGLSVLHSRGLKAILEYGGIEQAPASLVKNFLVLQGKLARCEDVIGVHPVGAAGLGLTVAKAKAMSPERVELDRLSEDERRDLARLLEKATKNA